MAAGSAWVWEDVGHGAAAINRASGERRARVESALLWSSVGVLCGCVVADSRLMIAGAGPQVCGGLWWCLKRTSATVTCANVNQNRRSGLARPRLSLHLPKFTFQRLARSWICHSAHSDALTSAMARKFLNSAEFPSYASIYSRLRREQS